MNWSELAKNRQIKQTGVKKLKGTFHFHLKSKYEQVMEIYHSQKHTFSAKPLLKNEHFTF